MIKTYKWGFVWLMILAAACNKDAANPSGSSSLTIVNGMMGSTYLRTSFSGDSKAATNTAGTVAQNSFAEFSGYLGEVPLALSPTTDTTKVVYDSTVNVAAYSIHSLFLGGTTTTPVSVYTTDTLPNTDDSVVSVRFANLYSGGAAVNVSVNDASGTIVAAGLGYPGVTSFLLFDARSSGPTGYVFSFKDAVTGTLISSYTLNSLYTYLHKDVAIVLKGMPGGTGMDATGTFLVKYYIYQ